MVGNNGPPLGTGTGGKSGGGALMTFPKLKVLRGKGAAAGGGGGGNCFDS